MTKKRLSTYLLENGVIKDKALVKFLKKLDDRVTALENNESNTSITYAFTSYADKNGETEWGVGTVETTGVISNGYTQVEVKTNSTDETFVGQKFYIISTAEPGNIYELFTDAGETSAEIYVKIN